MDKIERPLGPLVVDISGTTLTNDEIKTLQHPLVGMVILFTRNFENIEQLRTLTHDIHALRNPPLLIGVDHEGGRIQRFRQGFTQIPSMKSLGELYDTDSQRAHALTGACGLWIWTTDKAPLSATVLSTEIRRLFPFFPRL